MEIEEFSVTELTLSEKKVLNGGWPQLIITLFIPNVERIQGFLNGLREGYEQSTQEL